MNLYHGTSREHLESILTKGLIPTPNWDSIDLPVISLTDSSEEALINAYIVDTMKVELREKENPAQGYIALEINASHYRAVKKWGNEWWIRRTIIPEHIRVVREADYETVRIQFEEKHGK